MNFHLLLPEFGILELRSQFIHWSSKYQGVERPNNFHGVSCLPRFVCGLTFPILCSASYIALDGVKGAVNRWLLSLCFFIVFCGAGACAFSPLGLCSLPALQTFKNNHIVIRAVSSFPNYNRLHLKKTFCCISFTSYSYKIKVDISKA